MPGQPTPRPKTLFRRMERVLVGAFMTVMALVLERVVMRSIRKGGGEPAEAKGTALKKKGNEIDLEKS
jgi:hypothetical protein